MVDYWIIYATLDMSVDNLHRSTARERIGDVCFRYKAAHIEYL